MPQSPPVACKEGVQVEAMLEAEVTTLAAAAIPELPPSIPPPPPPSTLCLSQRLLEAPETPEGAEEVLAAA